MCLFNAPIIGQVTWIGPGMGNWNTPTNWDSGMVPGSNDDVIFNTSANVILDINPTIKSLLIDASGEQVVIIAGVGNTLSIQNGTVNDAGLYISGGSFNIGGNVNINLQNQINDAIHLNRDTIRNYGNINIMDYESIAGENDDGLSVYNGAVLHNFGSITINDTNIPGANQGSSYAMIANTGVVHNFQNATINIVTSLMSNANLGRDAMYLTNANFTNEGDINIGNGAISSIPRYGIFSNNTVFQNSHNITINGTTNIALTVDNPNSYFTNDGTIMVTNADDGVNLTNDAAQFINNSMIVVGSPGVVNVDDNGVRVFNDFINNGTIQIYGVNLQGILCQGDACNFVNSGIINIEDCGSEGLRVANDDRAMFTNDGGTINIGQGTGNIRGNSGLYLDKFGTFDNLNGGIINIDHTLGDGLRVDAGATFRSNGLNSAINIGLNDLNSIGDGIYDDGVLNEGTIINENNAVLRVEHVFGRGLRNIDFGIFSNYSGGKIYFDHILEACVYNTAKLGGKIINSGNLSEFNIGQNGPIGDGETSDYGIDNRGIVINEDGAVLNIDQVFNGLFFRNGTSVPGDSLRNDNATINIAQNSALVIGEAGLVVTDSTVVENLNNANLNISNVENYGIILYPQTQFFNSGNVNITDYEPLALGTDNGIKMTDAIFINDGSVSIQDPNTTGYIQAHGLYAINSVIDIQANGSISVGTNMASGKIGGNGIYFDNCMVNNAGDIFIGNGNTSTIGTNGIQMVETTLNSTGGSSININGTPINTNGILLGRNSMITNAGSITVQNTYRGINASSSSNGIANSGTINIGDGNTSGIGSHGIFSATSFINSGTIHIDGCMADGLRSGHPNATFSNYASGIITINNIGQNGLSNAVGSNNPSQFINDGGSIDIGLNGSPGNIAMFGFVNDEGGNFTNQNAGIIRVANASVEALHNDAVNNNQLLNADCSIIELNGNLYNSGSFENDAVLIMKSGTYSYLKDMNNAGYIQDEAMAFALNTGSVDGVINPGILTQQLDIPCGIKEVMLPIYSDNIPVSSTLNSPATNWFGDVTLSNNLGNYDPMSNTFTFNQLAMSEGLLPVYFNFASCNFIAKTNFNIGACGNCLNAIQVSGDQMTNTFYQAEMSINSLGPTRIPSNTASSFKAGDCIQLATEFEVEIGASFEAAIENCLGN